MVPGGSGMIAVMFHAGDSGQLAVIHYIGMRHAVDHSRAMTEGEHGRRRHEAKQGKGREQNREPEAQAGGKRGKHGRFLFFPCPQT